MAKFTQWTTTVPSNPNCMACSSKVIDAITADKTFIMKAIQDPAILMSTTGLDIITDAVDSLEIEDF